MGFWIGEQHDDGYCPPTIYRWLTPKRSGNSINGLGETDKRRPTPILWHRLKHIEFKLNQLLFQSRFRPRMILQHPGIALHFLRMKRAKKRLKTAQPHPIPHVFDDTTTAVKDMAMVFGADTVGITKLRPDIVFEGYTLPEWAQTALDDGQLYVVVMAVQHDKDCFESAPSWAFSKEIANQYNQGSDLALQVAHWILDKGYRAYGHGGPEGGEFLLHPLAIEAGIGELGKHGSLINPKLGANFRIACVYTTLPLHSDVVSEFGVDDFCTKCQICTKACPPQAINESKKTVRGEEKFYVDFDKCFPYMTDHYGCGICLKECPWSREDVVEKLYRKQQKRLFSNVFDKQVLAIDETVYQPSEEVS
ncbi:3-chloro-4-hydroxyphenylacetate reductive dehalogenase [BD1-7 clade bacterium]|uniref:3-chloro-4-hydroxyphenylacetate reductive dehalogenase n=1 Tax=BD1-7 clade bacterium TaxID=2029982 RepID=A0A5S9PFW7_9GAMM|nr:3-chloro-4-hydroxyphenylacetate reductive dehalogenase [BD1-7 clade bacterium]